MSYDPQLGNIGTIFEVTIKDQDDAVIDISGATSKSIIFMKPDETVATEKDATFTTDGTDGKMQFTSDSGFLDEAGYWKYQGYAVLAIGTFKSEIKTFNVPSNL